jgi:hypothetical protein
VAHDIMTYHTSLESLLGGSSTSMTLDIA